MRNITIYQVNHKDFQTIPTYGDVDLIMLAESESGFALGLETALNWLINNGYDVIPSTIRCFI